MKKFLKYLLIVLTGVVVFDILVSVVLDKNINKLYNTTITETYGANSEIAIIGASRAVYHYNPEIITDSLKMSAHVYGAGGQNIYFHYTVLRTLMERSEIKPKIVLLELSGIDVNNTPKWNTEKLNMLFPYYYSEPAVKEVLSEVLDNKELCVVKASGLYRHNSKLITYIKAMLFGVNSESETGYIPLQNTWTKPIEQSTEGKGSLDPMKILYIEKIINLCKAENVMLVFTISPYYKILSTDTWKREVYTIANKHNISLLDHEQDAYFLEHGEFFNEPFHLNGTGADIYSQIIVQDIKKLLNKY